MTTTVEDLVEQALSRCAEYGGNYPATRSLLYRRLGVRQQELFAAAARANPEYFGATAIGTLDANKAVSLATMGSPASSEARTWSGASPARATFWAGVAGASIRR